MYSGTRRPLRRRIERPAVSAGRTYRTCFYRLVPAALGGGLVEDGCYFRGANGRSGEIGLLLGRNATGEQVPLQHIVSLSAIYERLAASGVQVSSPKGLTRLGADANVVIERWIVEATEARLPSLAAANCLINPDAILIGGLLAARLIDRLAASSRARMADVAGQLPVVAQIARGRGGGCPGSWRGGTSFQPRVLAGPLGAPEDGLTLEVAGAPVGGSADQRLHGS